MDKKLRVDKNKCIGCGTCVVLCPKTFQMGKDGKSEVINEKGDSEADIKNAIDSCPVGAISNK
jgi:ferredoxin